MVAALKKSRTRWAIAAVVAFILLGWCWAYASPAGSATDDDYHLPNIWCAWGASDTCQETGQPGERLVPQRVSSSNCHVFGIVEDAGCVASLTNDLVKTTRVQDGHTPPLFYIVMRSFAGPNVYSSIILMRFFNVCLAALAIGLAALVSLRRERLAVVLGWTVILAPIGIFFIASTNPSSWVIIGAGTFWAFLVALLRRPWRQWQTKVALVGVLFTSAMMIGSRTDAAIVICLSVAISVLLAWPRVAIMLRRAPLAVLGFLLGFLVLVLAAWSVGLGSRVQAALSRLYIPPGDAVRDQPNAIVKALAEMPHFLTSFVGTQAPIWTQRESALDHSAVGYSTPAYTYGLASMEFPLPAAVGAILVAVVGAMLLLGLKDYFARKSVAICMAIAGLIATILLTRASVRFVEWSTLASFNLQPRYFYPMAILIVCITLIVRVRYRPILNPGQALLVGAGLVIAQAIALRGVLARYVHGIDHSWTQLDGPRGWWWPSGPTPDTVWLIAVFASIVLYGSVLYAASRPPRGRSLMGGRLQAEGVHPGPEAQSAPDHVVEGSAVGEHVAGK